MYRRRRRGGEIHTHTNTERSTQLKQTGFFLYIYIYWFQDSIIYTNKNKIQLKWDCIHACVAHAHSVRMHTWNMWLILASTVFSYLYSKSTTTNPNQYPWSFSGRFFLWSQHWLQSLFCPVELFTNPFVEIEINRFPANSNI